MTGFQKNDFIEMEFTAKEKDGEIFDSNRREVLEKLHEEHDHKIETKPFIFSLGQEMFLKGVDDFLIGKSTESYTIEVAPEDAFGKRNPQLIQMVSLNFFKKSNIQPEKGTMMNFDGKLGKIITISGGRVLVDFNNPLAGKDVIYDIKILRKVDDLSEKIKSFIEFLFKKDLAFEIKDKQLVIKVEDEMKKFVEMFKDKFKEIFDLELVTEEKGLGANESKTEEKEEN